MVPAVAPTRCVMPAMPFCAPPTSSAAPFLRSSLSPRSTCNSSGGAALVRCTAGGAGRAKGRPEACGANAAGSWHPWAAAGHCLQRAAGHDLPLQTRLCGRGHRPPSPPRGSLLTLLWRACPRRRRGPGRCLQQLPVLGGRRSAPHPRPPPGARRCSALRFLRPTWLVTRAVVRERSAVTRARGAAAPLGTAKRSAPLCGSAAVIGRSAPAKATVEASATRGVAVREAQGYAEPHRQESGAPYRAAPNLTRSGHHCVGVKAGCYD